MWTRSGGDEAGYVEGQNLRVEYRWAEGKPERFPSLAADLIALKVDVIVTAGGTLAAMAAKRATKTLPIVFTAVGDPVEEGLVTSLARPGGNITGLSVVVPDLIGKWVELLKQAVPAIGLVALLFKPDAMPDRAKEIRLREFGASALALGVRLELFEARGPEDFNRAFRDISTAGADALVVWSTPVFQLERQRLADLAAEHRLPTVFHFRTYVEAGGLMSYGPNLPDLNRRAAAYASKILAGTKPANLPVEQPTKFESVIDLKTAKALGLAVPRSLLARADEVIE